MKKISVLIVDDSAVIRSIFKDMLNAEPDIEVVDTACDPYDAREKIKKHNPQVITLDIEMPKMDGLSFLEKIMTLRPMPVIMVSTLTQKGAGETFRALELGAVDYISKPVAISFDSSLEMVRTELADKVRAAAQAGNYVKANATREKVHAKELFFTARPETDDFLIAMGSSTGGVEALREIFSALPAGLPPIVMTQHMPAQFTVTFSARLNDLSKVTVAEAKHGEILKAGHAYLAPGGIHLKIVRRGGKYVAQLEDTETVSGHKPSVDVLFSSVADVAKEKSVGIMLTGMGRDGTAGMLKMRTAGAYNVSQSERTCVVYGMPKSAVAAGAVHKELPLSDIAGHVVGYLEKYKSEN